MTSHSDVPATYIIPVSEIFGEDEEETARLRRMAREAEFYLLSHTWCRSIRRAYFGDGIGGVIAIFLFQIDPAEESVAEWIWVVCGDVPSAYMVTDTIHKPSEALAAYVSLMEDWLFSVGDGGNLKHVFPVRLEPTIENAKHLEKRLAILKDFFIPLFRSSEQLQA